MIWLFLHLGILHSMCFTFRSSKAHITLCRWDSQSTKGTAVGYTCLSTSLQRQSSGWRLANFNDNCFLRRRLSSYRGRQRQNDRPRKSSASPAPPTLWCRAHLEGMQSLPSVGHLSVGPCHQIAAYSIQPRLGHQGDYLHFYPTCTGCTGHLSIYEL